MAAIASSWLSRLSTWLGIPSQTSVATTAPDLQSEACQFCEHDGEHEHEHEREYAKEQEHEHEQQDAEAQTTMYAYMHSDCGLNRRELGRVSWAYLHTLANYYPESPSREQQEEMVQLLWLFIKYYPCGYCSDMSIQEMYRNPPRVSNRKALSEWMCQIHNEVNERMGKPLFDCNQNNLAKRWRLDRQSSQ